MVADKMAQHEQRHEIRHFKLDQWKPQMGTECNKTPRHLHGANSTWG